MRIWRLVGCSCALLLLAGCGGGKAAAGGGGGGGGGGNGTVTGVVPSGQAYAMGNLAAFTELWVSSGGNDNNTGRDRAHPLATLQAAVEQAATITTTPVRVNVVAGSLPFDEAHQNFHSIQRTATTPLVIRSVDGVGAATINAGLNLANCSYVYLLDLRLAAGGAAGAWGNDVLHLDGCDHMLVRGCTLVGLNAGDMQEVIKANQCSNLYLESCDISGTYQVGVDLFAVQYGQMIGCQVHNTGEWGFYAKGGSAYFRVQACEFSQCGLGLQAGEGSNLAVMRSPWTHYEVYDLKVVDNLFHDIAGTCLSSVGGYNVLFAHNTCVRVSGGDTGYPLVNLGFGGRNCTPTDALNATQASAAAAALIGQGGWGSSAPNNLGSDVIPNRNVWVLNNVFYNPTGSQTRWAHFNINAPVTPPAGYQNLPNPAYADEGLRLEGNLIWNGDASMPLGLDNARTLTDGAVRAANTINSVEPVLDGGYRPGANVLALAAVVLASFTWTDAPASPLVPAGNLSNALGVNYGGESRPSPDHPGAW